MVHGCSIESNGERRGVGEGRLPIPRAEATREISTGGLIVSSAIARNDDERRRDGDATFVQRKPTGTYVKRTRKAQQIEKKEHVYYIYPMQRARGTHSGGSRQKFIAEAAQLDDQEERPPRVTIPGLLCNSANSLSRGISRAKLDS